MVYFSTLRLQWSPGSRRSTSGSWCMKLGSASVHPGSVCCVWLPHTWPVLSAQLGGHLYCSTVYIPGTGNRFLHSTLWVLWSVEVMSFPHSGSSVWLASCFLALRCGKAILILSVTSCISGISEKLLLTLYVLNYHSIFFISTGKSDTILHTH